MGTERASGYFCVFVRGRTQWLEDACVLLRVLCTSHACWHPRAFPHACLCFCISCTPVTLHALTCSSLRSLSNILLRTQIRRGSSYVVWHVPLACHRKRTWWFHNTHAFSHTFSNSLSSRTHPRYFASSTSFRAARSAAKSITFDARYSRVYSCVCVWMCMHVCVFVCYLVRSHHNVDACSRCSTTGLRSHGGAGLPGELQCFVTRNPPCLSSPSLETTAAPLG